MNQTPDTAVYYLKKRGAIRIAVESLDYRLKHFKRGGLFSYIREKSRIARTKSLIVKGLKQLGIKFAFTSESKRVCLYHIEKMDLFTDLNVHIKEFSTRFTQLPNIYNWSSILVPVEFNKTFFIRDNSVGQLLVGSSVALLQELNQVADNSPRIRINPDNLASYFTVKEDEANKYEDDTDRASFWTNLSWAILHKLTTESIGSSLPIIID